MAPISSRDVRKHPALPTMKSCLFPGAVELSDSPPSTVKVNEDLELVAAPGESHFPQHPPQHPTCAPCDVPIPAGAGL